MAALALVIGLVLILSNGEEDQAVVNAPEGCDPVERPAPKTVELAAPEPGQVLAPGAPASAVVETSCGSFTIELDTTQAPETANSFAYLAEEGAFDGTYFHRIVPDFVIQGGDPQGTGMGGPGYSITEAPPADLAYEPGVVAMAKTEAEPAGTSGSQFFVVTGSAGATLTPDYALVGKVSQGMDVVEKIGALGDNSQAPTETVTIESVRVEQGGS